MKDKALERFSQILQVPTIAASEYTTKELQPFENFKILIRMLYPKVFRLCINEYIDSNGVLYKWKGQSSKKPSLIMAHYDVIDVNRNQCTEDPFGGKIINGEIYGRGAGNTKLIIFSLLEAINSLVENLFMPQNDIYFFFAGDAETTNESVQAVLQVLKRKDIHPFITILEGGGILKDVIPYVTKQIALIGTGEKGCTKIKLTASTKYGHAFAPTDETALGSLSEAVLSCGIYQYQANPSQITDILIKKLSTESNWFYNFIFKNQWLFRRYICSLFSKFNEYTNAMVRTTFAVTKIDTGNNENIQTKKASAILFVRTLNTTKEKIVRFLKKIIRNSRVKIEILEETPQIEFADINNDAYRFVEDTIKKTWPDTITAPFIDNQSSPAKDFAKFSEHVFKFSPSFLTSDFYNSIDDDDEKVPITAIDDYFEFYRTLIKGL